MCDKNSKAKNNTCEVLTTFEYGSNNGGGCSACCNISGETKTLNIIQEFKQLYESKMKIIEAEGNGDCNMQAKISLQQDWIRDLTEQNEMLVRAVEELEQEATERVLSLEEKLKQSSKCACEVMNSYKDMSTNLEATFKQMTRTEDDVRNLLEFIRRVRDEANWSMDGLHFYNVNELDLLGHFPKMINNNNGQLDKMSEDNKRKDDKIRDLERRLDTLSGNVQSDDGYLKTLAVDHEALKQAMLDMRGALTAEVADKHDMILNLKREVLILEEQCRKADQQTHFKDDIIKELRKEIKQLKTEKKALMHTKYDLSTWVPGSSLYHHHHHNQVQTKPLKTPVLLKKQQQNTVTYQCPINCHNNLGGYKDFYNENVIFICEDQSQESEVHKVYDSGKLKLIYRSPKVVHECSARYLDNLAALEHRTTTRTTMTHDGDAHCNHCNQPERLTRDASTLNVMHFMQQTRSASKVLCAYPQRRQQSDDERQPAVDKSLECIKNVLVNACACDVSDIFEKSSKKAATATCSGVGRVDVKLNNSL